jgi:glycosyltransferase involved in cell wall biosynthesis
LEAFKMAVEKNPRLRGLIIGRGTYRRQVAIEPARRMGLAEKIVFAGYRRQDYLAVFSAIDVKVFLVPGSDGTCRALREAMALGKPVIASHRGMLPELVQHGKTGLLIEEDAQQLATAMLRLAEGEKLRSRLGQGGRQYAFRHFSLPHQAKVFRGICERVLSRR